MSNYSINLSAVLNQASGAVSPGLAMCKSTDFSTYVVATTANLAAIGGEISGFALTYASISQDGNTGVIELLYNGELAASKTQLGIGTAVDIYVDPSGLLTRTPTAVGPVGKCFTDGSAKIYGNQTSGNLPIATLTNSFFQSGPGGPPFWAQITADQIQAAYTISLSLSSSSLVEVNATVTTPAFTATYNRTPAAAVLTDNNGNAPTDVIATPTSFSSPFNFTKTVFGQSVTFTLTANETGGPSKTATAGITWCTREFYGQSPTGTINEAFIEALPQSALSPSLARSFSATAGASDYLWFACRSAFGTPTFTVGGFVGGFSLVASAISVTNSEGYSENYDVYRSDSIGLGPTTVVVS